MPNSPLNIVTALIGIFKSLRASQSLTLEESAERAGIHRTHLGLLEKDQRQPTLQVTIQLAQAYDYNLSDLLLKAELIASGTLSQESALQETHARVEHLEYVRNASKLSALTGLTPKMLVEAIHICYKTLDTIDKELIVKGVPPVAGLVELANLSSMVGNLLGASIAEASQGLYKRNRPHAYPDLLPIGKSARNLELKMALETNRPKGHLPKPGNYITFRYVLGDSKGNYKRGKLNRGDTLWIWEVRVGVLTENDFDCSNTAGDSGKTATIKTGVFHNMALVYFDPSKCPYAFKNEIYPGLN